MTRALITADDEIKAKDLKLEENQDDFKSYFLNGIPTEKLHEEIKRRKKEEIKDLQIKHNNNKTKIAEEFDIDRKTLRKRMKEYGLD